MRKDLEAKEALLSEAIGTLTSRMTRVRKEGVSDEAIQKANTAGEDTSQFYDIKPKPLDEMARASIASMRMVDHASTIIRHMQARQEILDQHAAAEEKAIANIRT